MRPEHLDLLRAAGRPSLTPDGSTAVVSVVRPDLDADAYLGGLWAVPTDGSTPGTRLTNGPRDTAPAVSPDGRRVAFLRGRAGAPSQVHLTALDGGEPMALTDHPLGAAAPSWSPDGTRLAYTARVPDQGRYGTEDAQDKKVTPEAEPARLITEQKYRRDDLGFTRDRREHLFVLDVPSSDATTGTDLPRLPVQARQLTGGDHDDTAPTWSPDGTTLAFLSERHATREADLRSGAYLVSADRTEPDDAPTVAVAGDLSLGGLQWLPDGRLVLSGIDVGPTGRDFVGRQGRLFVTTDRPCPGAGPVGVRALTHSASVDLPQGPEVLSVAGGRVVVQDQCRGAVRLLSVDPDGDAIDAGSADVLLEGHLMVRAHAASADGTALAVSVTDAERLGDLAVVRDGTLHLLTDLGADLRELAGTRPLVELEAASEDGHPVHGWVVLPDPAAHGPGPYPVLLNIHGGPHAMYGWGLFDEAQVYSGAGYAVLMCNPRGAAGYGEDHARAIRGRMGTVDATDVLAFLDHALADEGLPLDPDRVGVMGGSYGGYMTALLTTRTRRFAAAVVERGYLDAGSFTGSSDIGWFFPGEYHGEPEQMAEQSPMGRVGEVTTPTLVIHSETDWRTPVEQGQRWFTALRARGVPVELLLFPGEGHELSRSGRPRHRRQRLEHILRWWGRHLPVG